MSRPKNVENLIKINALKEADRDQASIDEFVAGAQQYYEDCSHPGLSDRARFLMAYEAFHSRIGACAGSKKSAKPLRRRTSFGRSERIRTSGPCLPKTVLYQAELHSVRRWKGAGYIAGSAGEAPLIAP